MSESTAMFSQGTDSHRNAQHFLPNSSLLVEPAVLHVLHFAPLETFSCLQ